jgi:hypothetical protein
MNNVPKSMKWMPKREQDMVRNMNNVAPFMMMCEAVGKEALPSQIARLEEEAKRMFHPNFYEYPVRAALLNGIALNLEQPQ